MAASTAEAGRGAVGDRRSDSDMFGLLGDRPSTTETLPPSCRTDGRQAVRLRHPRAGRRGAHRDVQVPPGPRPSPRRGASQAREETTHPSPYVGDVLEVGFGKAQAFVVLLTPDDEAKLSEDFLKQDDPDYEPGPDAAGRLNVLFEAGMAMAAAPERTALVQIGNVRPFSDIGGRLVLRFEGSPNSQC